MAPSLWSASAAPLKEPPLQPPLPPQPLSASGRTRPRGARGPHFATQLNWWSLRPCRVPGPARTSLHILELDGSAPGQPGADGHLSQKCGATEAQTAAPVPEHQLQLLVLLDELHQPPQLLILLCQPSDLLPQALVAAEEGHARQQWGAAAGGRQAGQGAADPTIVRSAAPQPPPQPHSGASEPAASSS